MLNIYRCFIVVLITVTFGCSKNKQSETKKVVILPSLTFDMRISKNLTYSAFAILSESSGYLGRLDRDMVIESKVLKSYERKGNKFVINLDPQYRSVKNEIITAYDVIYSMKHYLLNHKSLTFVLKDIVGAKECIELNNCDQLSAKAISTFQLEVDVKSDNQNFIERLMNPWFVLLKKDKPLYETIGDCIVPYQTGVSKIIDCQKTKGITLQIGKNRILVRTENHKVDSHVKTYKLVNNNPSEQISASLTVMTIFANPNSSLEEEYRVDFLKYIREVSKKISNNLKLKTATMMASSWLDVQIESLEVTRTLAKKCRRDFTILLDSSLPNHEILKEHINKYSNCKIKFITTTADKYFDEFEKTDFGIAWFTPDELDAYNFYSSFDCNVGGNCYFNWKDEKLNLLTRKLVNIGMKDQKVKELEKYIMERGYAAPISELNWWVMDNDGNYKVIHPSGLAQLKISDFYL